MTKHAPGPWLIVHHPEPGVQCVAVVDGNRRADCRGFADGFAVLYCEDGVRNAHLIAAAPDMFDALRAMVDRWEPDCIGTDRVMWENAVAALAKAGGPS